MSPIKLVADDSLTAAAYIDDLEELPRKALAAVSAESGWEIGRGTENNSVISSIV